MSSQPSSPADQSVDPVLTAREAPSLDPPVAPSVAPSVVRHSRRTVRLPGTSNVRDVGGLPTADGRSLGPGRLFRGESLVFPRDGAIEGIFAEEARPAFRALGLRTVIDLRTPAEAAASPSAWAEASGAEMLLIPVAEGAEGSDTNLMGLVKAGHIVRFTPDDLGEMYVGALERRATEFAKVVRAVATMERQPILVHCAAGKDRTGLAMALILDVLGVPRDEVVADYTLTGHNRPDRVSVYAPRLVGYGVDPESVRTMFESPASAMHRALDHIDTFYRSAAGYLRDRGGLTEDSLEALRRTLIAASSD